MQDDQNGSPVPETVNAIYPSAGKPEIPSYQKELAFKGRDGDSIMQSGLAALIIVVLAVGIIIVTLHYLL